MDKPTLEDVVALLMNIKQFMLNTYGTAPEDDDLLTIWKDITVVINVLGAVIALEDE